VPGRPKPRRLSCRPPTATAEVSRCVSTHTSTTEGTKGYSTVLLWCSYPRPGYRVLEARRATARGLRIMPTVSDVLDDLARSLTRPMPRRHTLGLLGRALLWAALPAVLRPASARAAPCPQCKSADAPNLCSVPAQNMYGCHSTCCRKTEQCCTARDQVNCCTPPYVCTPTIVGRQELAYCKLPPCSAPNKRCGENCCGERQTCDRGTCRCEDALVDGKWYAQRTCGKSCCAEWELCCGDHCCALTATCCGSGCCPRPQICCGNNCCPPGTMCCGNTCCTPGSVCCDNRYCCRSGYTCCGNGGCCPPGTSCSQREGRAICT